MSRYDDPGWYEDQETNPRLEQFMNDDFHTPHVPSSSKTSAYGSQPQSVPPPETRHRSRRFLGQALVIASLLVVAFLGGWFSHQYFGDTFFNQSDKSRAYAQLFQQAWVTIDQNYVDRNAVNYKQMSYKAIQAMVDSLHDTGHTRFLTPEQIQSENEQLSGTFTGIGIYLRQDKNTKHLIITSPIPGSPAEKAGMKHGDIIVAVNGTNIVGQDIASVSKLIQGKIGTSVAITVQRPSLQRAITFHVPRAEIKVPSVVMHYIAEDRIAHIQIVQFSDEVANQLKDSLNKARSMGARRIILDLRDDPGGYLKEAVNTVSEFQHSGNVLLEQDSTGQRTAVPVNGNTVDTTDPIVVLVNGNTASAAEIVSGALQDNHRAVIMGEKTFGTGTVLQQFSLSDGSAILIGTQEWLTPNGQFIRDKGIIPNISVALNQNTPPLTPSDENSGMMTEQQILSSGDTQLVGAISYLKHK